MIRSCASRFGSEHLGSDTLRSGDRGTWGCLNMRHLLQNDSTVPFCWGKLSQSSPSYRHQVLGYPMLRHFDNFFAWAKASNHPAASRGGPSVVLIAWHSDCNGILWAAKKDKYCNVLQIIVEWSRVLRLSSIYRAKPAEYPVVHFHAVQLAIGERFRYG